MKIIKWIQNLFTIVCEDCGRATGDEKRFYQEGQDWLVCKDCFKKY